MKNEVVVKRAVLDAAWGIAMGSAIVGWVDLLLRAKKEAEK